MNHRSTALDIQKQPSRGVLSKRCSEDMQQIYWGTPMPKCDFNKVAKQLYEITLRHGCSPVNLLHISRTPFTINTSERVLLDIGFCSVLFMENFHKIRPKAGCFHFDYPQKLTRLRTFCLKSQDEFLCNFFSNLDF